jgi:NAD(P)H-flavin reductase
MEESVIARVQSVAAIAERVNRIILRVPETYRWRGGQYLVAALASKPAHYSIASACRGDGLLELAVRESTEAEAFVVGAALSISPAQGQSVIPAAPSGRRYCFVAIGTGVAPLRAAIQEVVLAGIESRLTLLHGARTAGDRLFSGEFEQLEARDLLDYRPVVSQPDEGWAGRTGRVQLHLSDLPEADHYGVCGNLPMVEEVAETLQQQGVTSLFAQGY